MIVKILYQKKPGAGFPGVTYNTSKVDHNKGELMQVRNFGALQALANLRPQDYINYLQSISALNTHVRKPQFHAAISGKGKLYHKQDLTRIAEAWLKEMGYGHQPYLVVYHKDTSNNHVHVVSARVARDGTKINSAFEKIRSLKAMNKVLGYDYALSYRFSTRAQFFMLLEQAGYPGLDPDEKKLQEKLNAFRPDSLEKGRLKQLLMDARSDPEKVARLNNDHQVELVFHAAEGKKPYGYTIIDHQQKVVYKGSEVLSLKELFGTNAGDQFHNNTTDLSSKNKFEETVTTHIQSVWIADDVDDQQIHGMRRKRQRKARTNTR